MRIALLQINVTVGALEANVDAILRAARRAHELGADLAVTSELALLGYPPRDLLERPAFVRSVLAQNDRLVAAVPQGLTLVFGTIEPTEGEGRPLYNSALVASGGKVLGRARKRLLPTYDVFDEDRYFEPGDRATKVSLACGTIGLTICEDAWNDLTWLAYRAYGGRSYVQAGGRAPRYHENPVGDLVAQKIDLLVNLSASPFTIAKRRSRGEMFAQMAQLHQVPIAFVNQVGANDELIFDGRSALFSRDGTVKARAAAFAEDLVICDLATGGPVAADVSSDEEAAYRALVLGTKDYARKCGFERTVVGLSGGIDSALTATIAADALGPENVVGVAMPSRYSSEGSRADARRLAANLGIELREISIEPMFQAYLAGLSPELDALAATCPGDVTFENVQARIRGTLLMAISNRTGALLLTTGNKSEIGVGYCTLYGDMAGGLAVISDVPKTMVYRLAHDVNRERERIPRASIEKAPSAELCPGQTDQDTLPPYELLDRVLERFVEDGADRDAIVAEGIAPSVVDRVISLVQGSEYKRRQAAPGLILTKKAFGVGRRMPIAQKFRE
ncbi:MAG TPA: NAD+ synthase [Polyangiaceae bacterium]